MLAFAVSSALAHPDLTFNDGGNSLSIQYDGAKDTLTVPQHCRLDGPGGCNSINAAVSALEANVNDALSRLSQLEANVNTLNIAVGARQFVGHCVDAKNARPPHCFNAGGVLTQQACRDACFASAGCAAYEWGQRDVNGAHGPAGSIYCQLVYEDGHGGSCPDKFAASAAAHPRTGNTIVAGQGTASGAMCHVMPDSVANTANANPQQVCELRSGVSKSVSNGGTSGNRAFTAPGDAITGPWYITMGQNVYSNGNFYWISNMFDGSNSCNVASTCSMRDRVGREHAHNCYMLMNGGCGGNDYIDISLERPTFVSYVSVDPLYRGDSSVTSFRVQADGTTYLQSSEAEPRLSTINANRGFTGDWSKNGASGSSCNGDDRWIMAKINAVVSTIRIGNIRSSGHCGMGEIKLFGHGDCGMNSL